MAGRRLHKGMVNLFTTYFPCTVLAVNVPRVGFF